MVLDPARPDRLLALVGCFEPISRSTARFHSHSARTNRSDLATLWAFEPRAPGSGWCAPLALWRFEKPQGPIRLGFPAGRLLRPPAEWRWLRRGPDQATDLRLRPARR